jgi:hypothetical protein
MMKKVLSFFLIVPVLVCFSALPVVAQEKQKEHPEHPTQKPKEHPKEHPTSGQKASLDQIDKAIRAHIDKVAKESGGRFPVQDDVLKKTWQLELARVHKDKLQSLADGTYFACVDFKAEDGSMVDVDFFLKKTGDELAVTDTSVHKVDGKPRYHYEEKDGAWVKVPEKS